jgi:hypothetical protein
MPLGDKDLVVDGSSAVLLRCATILCHGLWPSFAYLGLYILGMTGMLAKLE